MIRRTLLGRLALMLVALVGLTACERDVTGLEEAPFPNDALVFGDAPGPGLDWFFAFDTSVQDPFPFQFDADVTFRGDGAVRIEVPGPGQFVGGTYISSVGRNLTEYNALTFWARASTNVTMNEVGYGLDFAGDVYRAGVIGGVPLSTGWTKVVVPIPDASKLLQQRGMFWMSEVTETGSAYQIWVDEMQFETIPTFANPRAMIRTRTVSGEVGGQLGVVEGGVYTVNYDGRDIATAAAGAYFDYTSSNTAVAEVTADGTIQLVGAGTATVTATVGGVEADGSITVNVTAPPAVAPPTPDEPAEEVISLFSDAYDDVPVTTFSAVWDAADVEDIQIAGDNVKRYTNLAFAGIEFLENPIDATQKGYLHIDVWAAAPDFKVKLVNFNAGGGLDSEFEIALTDATDPALTPGGWSSLDIPLTAFAGMNLDRLSQIVLSSAANPTLYIDNLYFHGEPAPTGPQEPAVAAPTPTQPAAGVISLFSDAYTDVPVDVFSTPWDAAEVEDVSVAGNATKRYTGASLIGIETVSQTIDATGMTHFHVDLWTPDAVNDASVYRIKLVDFGADGGFGGGDDAEHELSFTPTTTPALAGGTWVSFDLPLADFAGLTTRSNMAQYIFSGSLSRVFLDNLYFYNDAVMPPPTPTEPTMPAPTPTYAAEAVISLFSDAYTDVTVDAFSTGWDAADVEDVDIQGSAAKKYTGASLIGMETGSAQIDASGMTNFRIDVWTADEIDETSVFRIKLVSFGDDGAFGGDDVEGELSYTTTTTPSLAGGTWITFDIPLSQFTTLTQTANMAQYILSGSLSTIWVDNILFYDANAAPAPTEPGSPAPTPTYAAENVISLFSDAYTDVTVDAFSTGWDAAEVEDVDIQGNAAKKYTGASLIGMETGSAQIDATGMTHFRIDVWTPDEIDETSVFRIKLVSFGNDGAFAGGDDAEGELSYTPTTTPALTGGTWLTFDIPLSEFTTLTQTANMAQYILSGNLSTLWVDNILFHN